MTTQEHFQAALTPGLTHWLEVSELLLGEEERDQVAGQFGFADWADCRSQCRVALAHPEALMSFLRGPVFLRMLADPSVAGCLLGVAR